jgi:hypothetical protein
LGSSVENYEYSLPYLPPNAYSASFHHDNVTGAYKAWSPGAIVVAQATTYPTGKTYSYQVALESATYWGFYQTSFVLDPGKTIRIKIWIKKDANSMTELPQVQLINSLADPLELASYTPLDSYTMTDDLLWQEDTLSYTNSDSYPMTLILRFQGKNATGNVYAYYEHPEAGGIPRSRVLGGL